jgi:hypothetical protein
MAMLWRLSVGTACLLGLAGCNNVISLDPWFTAADAQGAPKFRDGLWLSASEEDCRVNVVRPAERWPDCARATYVRGHETFAMEWDDPDGDGPRRRTFAGWQKDPTVIANGDPLIGQIQMEGDSPTTPSDSADGEAEAEAGAGELPPRYVYFYRAIRPTRFDEQGNVVAAESWGVVCGPVRKPYRNGQRGAALLPMMNIRRPRAT